MRHAIGASSASRGYAPTTRGLCTLWDPSDGGEISLTSSLACSTSDAVLSLTGTVAPVGRICGRSRARHPRGEHLSHPRRPRPQARRTEGGPRLAHSICAGMADVLGRAGGITAAPGPSRQLARWGVGTRRRGVGPGAGPRPRTDFSDGFVPILRRRARCCP